MTTETQQFAFQDLRGARFVESDLSGVVMRGVLVSGMDIDAPWLSDGAGLIVNGVDVAGYVEAELDCRFPGREQRQAADPDGLRTAWDAMTAAWASSCEHAAALPDGVVDASVDRAWSFTQTLRHLVLAEPRHNPHEPDRAETVRSCLHVILEEGWEHLRFARRDLDTLTAAT